MNDEQTIEPGETWQGTVTVPVKFTFGPVNPSSQIGQRPELIPAARREQAILVAGETLQGTSLIKLSNLVKVELKKDGDPKSRAEVSPGFVVNLLGKLGDRHGTHRRSGSYNQQDPTHYEEWRMPVMMEIGFGSPIVHEDGDADPQCGPSNETFPPNPELVTVTWRDVTWGVTIAVIGDNVHVEGYWDHQSKAWTFVKLIEHKDIDALKAEYKQGIPQSVQFDKLHEVLVRIIEDGDWGNDKLTPPGEHDDGDAENGPTSRDHHMNFHNAGQGKSHVYTDEERRPIPLNDDGTDVGYRKPGCGCLTGGPDGSLIVTETCPIHGDGTDGGRPLPPESPFKIQVTTNPIDGFHLIHFYKPTEAGKEFTNTASADESQIIPNLASYYRIEE